MKPSILILLAIVLSGCGDGGTEPGMEAVPPAFLATWGGYGDDDGEFFQPHDIAVGPDGSIYVTDLQNRRVQRFTDDGVYISQWEMPRLEVYSIAVGKNDLVYVRGWERSGVSRFNNNGENLGALSGAASGGGIEVRDDGSVYVAGNNYVRKLDEDGEEQDIWSVPLEEESKRFRSLAIEHDEDEGTYVVGDGWAGPDIRTEVSLWKFDQAGQLVWKKHFDTDLYISGVATDSKGNVYVTSATEGKIKKFSRNGIFLLEWSEVSPNDEPLDWPTGIAIDAEDNVYVADLFRDRVVKFGTKD